MEDGNGKSQEWTCEGTFEMSLRVGSDGNQTRYQAGTYDGMWNEWVA